MTCISYDTFLTCSFRKISDNITYAMAFKARITNSIELQSNGLSADPSNRTILGQLKKNPQTVPTSIYLHINPMFYVQKAEGESQGLLLFHYLGLKPTRTATTITVHAVTVQITDRQGSLSTPNMFIRKWPCVHLSLSPSSPRHCSMLHNRSFIVTTRCWSFTYLSASISINGGSWPLDSDMDLTPALPNW